jgi:uncharacterized protein YbjT (DUF2867 family)
MASILVTGATGNIGIELIEALFELNTKHEIYAGVRNIEKARSIFWKYPQLKFKCFDFEDTTTFTKALDKIDMVFLLRPPHIADLKKHIQPLFEEMKDRKINNIVFLSVQGAEANKHIPHFKIERLIEKYGFRSIFIRPSYFMQNLTTTLVDEIRLNNRIYIPAKNLKLNWIDTKDIGLASATAIVQFETLKNSAFEITGKQNYNFSEVAEILSNQVNFRIRNENPGLLRFMLNQRRKKKPFMLIFVMIMLHYLPALQRVKPKTASHFYELTGKQPRTLTEFISREKHFFN